MTQPKQRRGGFSSMTSEERSRVGQQGGLASAKSPKHYRMNSDAARKAAIAMHAKRKQTGYL